MMQQWKDWSQQSLKLPAKFYNIYKFLRWLRRLLGIRAVAIDVELLERIFVDSSALSYAFNPADSAGAPHCKGLSHVWEMVVV